MVFESLAISQSQPSKRLLHSLLPGKKESELFILTIKLKIFLPLRTRVLLRDCGGMVQDLWRLEALVNLHDICEKFQLRIDKQLTGGNNCVSVFLCTTPSGEKAVLKYGDTEREKKE